MKLSQTVVSDEVTVAPENFLELLAIFEKSISELPSDRGEGLDGVRNHLGRLVNYLCRDVDLEWRSYSQLTEKIISIDRHTARDVALLLIRSLDVVGLIPNKKIDNKIEASIVSMVVKLLPDFAKKFKIDEKKQTYENFIVVCSIHKQILDSFDVWSNLPQSVEGVVANKSDVYKGANTSYIKTYLKLYDLKAIVTTLKEMFALLTTLISDENENFFDPLEKLKDLIENQFGYVNDNHNFITAGYYKSLLNSVKKSIESVEEASSDRFRCEISPKSHSVYLAEKKYPLHEPDREITIRIPMINSGPGIAKDILVEYYDTSESGLALACSHNIGNIRSGEFELVVNALVVDAVKESVFEFLVSWRQQGNANREENIFQCKIQAQSPDIDWEALRDEEPYSTEIAEGSEFVGRANKVNALVKRALKSKMQSSYISGQKRIGKTSLAIAVVNYINEYHKDKNIFTHYIEWGEVADSDSSQSLSLLGRNIADFLEESLPVECSSPSLKFDGSLSQLNVLANLLLKVAPDNKFLIILDEFDEIHPEMYRYGRLAEAFFANLRTLSSKKNMAFMLVGGENMPFVINAQGDQLNRFVYESLDYFSKEGDEYDYNQLVTKPTEKFLSWSDESVRELFYLTNGHPFYTKLICSEVFSSAVVERDSEICNREISSSVNKLIDSLDVNSFAHHWKDGIQKTELEAESIALNRCRCLVAIGRAVRDGLELTYENICKSNKSSHLSSFEIKSILSDFVRRGIIKETSVKFEFRVPFFEKWLVNKGIGVLIADTSGDDLAEAKLKDDERIRVRPAEIEALTEHWQPYRGQDINSEKVRFWLEQVDSIPEQRILFKLLKNLRFLNEVEVRGKLKTAHDLVRSSFSLVVQKTKRQLRKDIVVSYLDGEAKSGQYFASRYAEENSIPSGNVISSDRFSYDINKLEATNSLTTNGMILVDDIVATGKSMSTNLECFLEENKKFIEERSLAIVVVVLVATNEGEKAVRKTLAKFENVNIKFRVCENLNDKHFAFSGASEIWESEDEYDRAKVLCKKIGTYVQKRQPLGYDNQGLLVVFPDRCPNNTVPLLHGVSHGDVKWKPLFPRPKN